MNYTICMRDSFSLNLHRAMPVDSIKRQLRSKIKKYSSRDSRHIEGLPTEGNVIHESPGVLLYKDVERGITTLITYEKDALHVAVIGGDEKVRTAWKNYLRTYHPVPVKRGRPPKSSKDRERKTASAFLIESIYGDQSG